MAEFRLERFKYNWRGDWATGTSYKRDDVVRVGGKSYVCIVTHVSSPAFRTDLNAILPGSVPPQPQPKWTVMTNGRSFEGDWTSGTDYNLGDIVLFQGSLWLCNESHAATTFDSDFDYWEEYSLAFSFEGDWSSSTSYGINAIVKYNGIVYKCINPHTSGSTLELNQSDWEVYFDGVEYKGDWSESVEYRKNDIVKFGGSIYKCTETHTSSAPALDITKFDVEIFGTEFENLWTSTTYYNIGDVVRHDGFVYYAVTNNINSVPYSDNTSTDWNLLSKGFNFVGDWSINGNYKTGDVVKRGGNLYLALRDIGTIIETDAETGEPVEVSSSAIDGSTVDYLQDDTWELLAPSKSFKGNWAEGIVYSVGDVIYYRNTSYVCNFEHESGMVNRPGDNGNGYYYWDILLEGGEIGGLEQKGDLLTYGLSRQFDDDGSTIYDDSTLGNTRVAIGEAEQLLSVSSDLEVFWRNITEDAESVFVSTNGIDAAGRGTFEKPFRTIRYAAEHVEDNYDPLTPVIIRVSAGKFEEIGPIIVPAGCAINGDELRSTTIIANSPIEEYQGDLVYVKDYTDHLINIILDVLTGVQITPQPGNTEDQYYKVLTPVLDELTGEQLIDQFTGEPVFQEDLTFPTSNLAAATEVAELITDFINYVEFNSADGSISPTLSGTNTLNSDDNFTNASEILRRNGIFLEKELLNFILNENPTISFNEQRVQNDIHSLLRGIIYDLSYPGNYGTLTAARRYSNAVSGSQRDNLFFLRDTTGLRDCTTGGLGGVLNPPGVFDLYQKPTGGALVSLDPGWGPNDERTWIINRSPYIQGVTNTGTGCVGMKVDGALHNGGNKSMTANDFTQVLSDGIGAWITNNARAELVSVFTYYCQIGYFAEDGGIIRSTNGNNSYGRYGSIADGVDDTEIPQVVTVNNRNNQAIVKEALAGGTTDELLLFEYENAGENYTQADATIVGAGANADVEFSDFRYGGIFEARLTSPDGSSDAGGGGYKTLQGSAQETLGASSTIKLSANDVTQQLSEIEGMRILITDGTGVGQYGYVSDFDFVTKTVTVTRDSDDQEGWDHVIPGTPIATNLDLTTRYRIEPRVTVDLPPFTTQAYNSFTNRSYVDLEFGNTTETYLGLSAGSEPIWKDDNGAQIILSDIISDIAAQFTGVLAENPTVPLNIRGRTSGATATITAFSANVDNTIEVNVSGGGMSSFTEGEAIDLLLASGTGETFDTAPTPAEFNILREGETYTVTLASGGAGYSTGDVITIPGTSLNGTTPDNDITITVTSTSSDSTNSILTFTSSGRGRLGQYVLLTDSEYVRYSEDGSTFTETTMPFIADYRRLIAGNNRFLALANGEDRIASSLNGETDWTIVDLPLSASWRDGTYSGSKFVLVADDTDVVATSTDGGTWTTSSIPNDTVGDSTIAQWTNVAYGNGVYLVVSGNDRATATSSDAVTWTRNDQSLPDFGGETIVSLVYGNNRFIVATADGSTAYSFDGVTWYTGGSLVNGNFKVSKIKFSQGLFFAIGQENGTSATTTTATSEYGLIWTFRTLPASQIWTAVANGVVNGTRKWVVAATAGTTNGIVHVGAGSCAKLRADVVTGSFDIIKVWDAGSGYDSENPPQITITDPNFTFEATTEARIGNGVLPPADFINRGAGYRSTTSVITISGNGYADIIPVLNVLTVQGVQSIPGPGVQIEIAGVLDVTTDAPDDLYTFSGVEVFDLGDDGTGNETRLVQFTISPRLETYLNIQHGTEVTLRERFSQCRISGHDFLDVGTGNFEQTNYPELYAGGAFFTASPENEVYETAGGRIFYVSTDQDGNFRTGELFSVQQATGIVTISAQFFDLDGLSELALGGVRLGGSGTVVNEFSTDPTFAADSNNVIPTQRAIASFLADRLSVGGESLEVNRLQAGRVIVGGDTNEFNNASDEYLIIPSDVVFNGTFETNDGEGNITVEQTNVSGTIVSQMLFFKPFDETMQ